MAIQILFDSANNVKSPTMVLTYRSGKSIGAILPHNLHYSESLNACNEMSFDVYKDINGVECQYWSNIKDFRLVYCVEWDEYFEIYVEIDEADETIKHIQGRSLSEAELSQIKVYGLEVNTELDISREDYRPTIIYSSDEEISLIHKLLEKTPNFEIEHVDISIAKLQRTFTFDDKTVYDALQEVSEETKCLIEFKSKKGSNGKIKRSISIYDLSSFCEECGHRNIDGDVCPKYADQESAHATYKGKNINPGFGEDTSIFVSRKKLTDNITYSSDVDSVKNCFKLTAGDDLMTATVRNCSPSKSGYLWHFTQEMMSDMSSELRVIIGQYQAAYDQYNTQFKDGDINYGTDWMSILSKYNLVCNKYKSEYVCPNKFTNYLDIMNTYYNAIDLELYLRSSMMPSVDLDDLTNTNKASTHISTISGSHTVYLQNTTNLKGYSAKNAIESYLRTVVDPKFQIKLSESSFSNNIWNGVLTLVSYSNDDDIGAKNITVLFSNDESGYTKQKLETSLAKTKAETPDIIELYSIGSTVTEETQKFNNFKTKIGEYGLVPLTRLRDAGQACLNILIEMGVGGDKANTLWFLNWQGDDNSLYNSLYKPYYNRVTELNKEIKERQKEIDDVVGKFDTNGYLVEHGMMSYLEDIVSELQEKLDLEGYINTFGGLNATELLKELVSFRREDTYKNDNFISEGLDNAQVFSRALEFVAEADKDIRAAAVPIHTISSTLKNLLVMKEFKGIVDKFKVGNWIRAEIDSEIFKLRLIRYDIGFDDINNIQVEFSDVQSVKDSMADIQSILNQASSIAGNYSNIKIEVDNNKKAGDYVWEWVNDGLALTKMKIVDDAENQNIYWDENGFLCREYSPVMDAYEDKQLKIINKGLYLTDDNWMTTRTGIGNFIYYDPKDSMSKGEAVYKESYGVIADTLVGNLILSKEVGIYNEGNSIQMDSNGFVITINKDNNNYNQNVFKIRKDTGETETDQEGKTIIKYDDLFYVDSNGDLRIKGHITASSIELGTDDDNNLGGLVTKDFLNDQSFITSTGYSADIEAIYKAIAEVEAGNDSYIQEIGSISDKVVFFATAYGDAINGYYYNGNFYKDYINGAYENLITPYDGRYYYDISSGEGYRYDGTYPYGAYSQTGIPGKTFAIKKDGSLIATDAVIKGTIYATDGEFFGNMKSGLKTSGYHNFDVTAGVVKMGYLGYENGSPRYAMTINSNGTIVFDSSVNLGFSGSGSGSGGTESGGNPGSSYTLPDELEFLKDFVTKSTTQWSVNYVFSPTIAGGTLLMGDENGIYAKIDSNGNFFANSATINGNITSGTIYHYDQQGALISSGYNFAAQNGTVKIGYQADGTYAMTVGTDGKIKFGSGVTLEWGEDQPDVVYNSEDQDLRNYLGLGTHNFTNIGQKHIISPYIFGGYLEIGSGTTSAKIDSSGKLTATGADISGTITATDGSFTGDLIAKSLTIDSTAEIKGIISSDTSKKVYSYWNLNTGIFKVNSIMGSLTMGDLSDVVGTQVNYGTYFEMSYPSGSNGIIIHTYGSKTNAYNNLGMFNSTSINIQDRTAVIKFMDNYAYTNETVWTTYIDSKRLVTKDISCNSIMVSGYPINNVLSELTARIEALEGGVTTTCTINVTNATNGGTVTPVGSIPYTINSSVTITATPHGGYRFVSWCTKHNGTATVVSTDRIYTFTVTGDETYYAYFELIPDTFNLEIENHTNLKSVRVVEASTNEEILSSNSNYELYKGKTYYVSGEATDGNTFNGWTITYTNGATEERNSVTIAINDTVKKLTPNISKGDSDYYYTISIETDNAQAGYVKVLEYTSIDSNTLINTHDLGAKGSVNIKGGRYITIMAYENTGYSFKSWFNLLNNSYKYGNVTYCTFKLVNENISLLVNYDSSGSGGNTGGGTGGNTGGGTGGTVEQIYAGITKTVDVAQCATTGGPQAQLSDFTLVKFVPTQSGTYQFESIGVNNAQNDDDTYGALYNAGKSQQLIAEDGGGSDGHFRFTYECVANTTYYFAVKYFYARVPSGTMDILVSYVSGSGSGGGSTSYTATTSVSPAGVGTVDVVYLEGNRVQCTATSTVAGYTLTNWIYNGSTQSSTSNPITFVMSGNCTITAVFSYTGSGSGGGTTTNNYTVTVNSSNTNQGTVSGGGTYPSGTSVTITASPKTGYKFVQWNDGNINASRTITVTGNVTYTATFASNSGGGTGGGTKTMIIDTTMPSGSVDVWRNGTKVTSSTNEYTFDIGDEIKIEAHPNAGRKLYGWMDTGNGTGYITDANPYTFTVSSSTTTRISASFSLAT